MSRILVFALFAAIMGFALGGSFAWSVMYVPPQHHTAHDQAADTTSDNERDKVEGLWERTSRDPTAFFTALLVVFTAVLAVSTIGLWIVTRNAGISQARDMKASIAAAKQSAELVEQNIIVAQRPWIRAEVTDRGGKKANVQYIEPMGLTTFFNVRLTNVGLSPATNVRIYCEALFRSLDGPTRDSATRQREICERQRRDNISPVGANIFPGDPVIVLGSANTPAAIVKDVDRECFLWGQSILVCVTYDFLDRTFLTSFIFSVQPPLGADVPRLFTDLDVTVVYDFPDVQVSLIPGSELAD